MVVAKTSCGFFLCLLLSCSLLAGQSSVAGLPKEAYILERRPLAIVGYPNRELVLWMLHPERHPSLYSFGQGDRYTCPEMTRGSYLSGALRVTLVDTQQLSVVNTVEVKDFEGNDSFDIPFAILKNIFYRTTTESESKESKPIVMWLRDYVGSGKPLQFALFQALYCMGLQTTLIGYEPDQDRVQQYETKLRVSEGRETQTNTVRWVDYLFSEKPVESGHWKYKIDYRGRCGSLDSYDIRFVPEAHRFEGMLERTASSCK